MPIRALTPADAHAYIALRREMLADSPWAFTGSPEDDEALNPAVVVTRVSTSGQAILGAFDDAPADASVPRLLGAAGIFKNRHFKRAHRAYIWGVYITPAARGRGLATRLLTATIDLARTWPGITSVDLAVTDGSESAQRFYERLGFVAWGREPSAVVTGGRAYDEIHMVKFLAMPA